MKKETPDNRTNSSLSAAHDNESGQTPKIEFPCQYPIKIIGDAEPDFQELVVDIVRQHDPGFDHASISLNMSRNGRFVSVRLHIEATGKEQLQSLHTQLMATGRVKMVI